MEKDASYDLNRRLGVCVWGEGGGQGVRRTEAVGRAVQEAV